MEDSKVVELIRRLRHDMGNYLQVISGYADLGRLDEVKAYVAQISSIMASERVIFEKLAPPTSLYLFQVLLFAHELGIILKYKDLQLKGHQLLLKENEPYNALAQVADQLGEVDEDPVVYLSLLEQAGGLLMVFACEHLSEGQVEVLIRE